MLTVIVNQNKAGKEQMDALLSQLKSNSDCQIALVKGDNIASEVTQATQRSSCNTFIMLDAGLQLNTTNFNQITSFINSQPHNSFRYFPLNSSGETYDIEDTSAENLVNLITGSTALPLLCCGFSRSILEKAGELRGTSTSEIAAEIMICAIAQGEMVSAASEEIPVSLEILAQTCLTNTSRSRLLRRVVDSCNIEDLYPNHPWNAHQKESAAACYHSLTAIFLRLGDLQTAGECLSLSDNFEDSPRSLALKAMIAQQQGETLGAVANMVSSLQQYELRKSNEDGSHYLSFKPNDLEVINESLKSGLAALNKRDNETALQHFSAAVFNFDPFYSQHGLN